MIVILGKREWGWVVRGGGGGGGGVRFKSIRISSGFFYFHWVHLHNYTRNELHHLAPSSSPSSSSSSSTTHVNASAGQRELRDFARFGFYLGHFCSTSNLEKRDLTHQKIYQEKNKEGSTSNRKTISHMGSKRVHKYSIFVIQTSKSWHILI